MHEIIEEKTLAQRLKTWRLAHHFTQHDAARELGMPFRTMQDIERGVSESTGYARACLERMLTAWEATQPEPQPKPQ